MTPEPGRLARYYHQAAAETLRLIPTDAQRVLDLGCADGSFGVTVKDRTGAELWGIVSDEHTTRPASAVTERVLTEDLEREIAQLPDGYFDAVICVDVLERLVEPGAALHKLRTKLKPDGVVVAAVPNFRFLPALGQVLFRKDFPQEDFGPFDRTYLRFFHPPEHCANLQEGGLADTADRGHQRVARPAGCGDCRSQFGVLRRRPISPLCLCRVAGRAEAGAIDRVQSGRPPSYVKRVAPPRTGSVIGRPCSRGVFAAAAAIFRKMPTGNKASSNQSHRNDVSKCRP